MSLSSKSGQVGQDHVYFHQGFVVLSPKASTWPEPWEVLLVFVKQKNERQRDGVF